VDFIEFNRDESRVEAWKTGRKLSISDFRVQISAYRQKAFDRKDR
jgi:hypothetical protein